MSDIEYTKLNIGMLDVLVKVTVSVEAGEKSWHDYELVEVARTSRQVFVDGEKMVSDDEIQLALNDHYEYLAENPEAPNGLDLEDLAAVLQAAEAQVKGWEEAHGEEQVDMTSRREYDRVLAWFKAVGGKPWRSA